MKRRLIASISIAAFSLAGLQAEAAVVVSNLDPADYGTSTNFVGQDIGQAIMTGTEGVSLTSVVFPETAGPAAGQTFGVYVRNPDNTAGSELYGGFTMAFDSFTDQTTATVDGTFVLAPKTGYWFVLESNSTLGAVDWNYTTTTSYSSAFGATLPANDTSFVSNGTRSTYYNLSNGPQVIDVNGVPIAVPEPSAATFLGVALAIGMLAMAHRRREKV